LFINLLKMAKSESFHENNEYQLFVLKITTLWIICKDLQ